MKSNKFILSLLSVCVAMSAVSLSACDETESSSSPSSPTSSSSSSSSSNPAEEAVSTTVNETEWNTALSANAFVNYTASGMVNEQSTEFGTDEYTVLLKVAGNVAFTENTGNFSQALYYTVENETLYYYTNESGTYKKSAILDPSLNTIFDCASVSSYQSYYAERYSSFTYDETEKTYTATDLVVDEYTNIDKIVLGFTNGKLTYIQESETYSYGGTSVMSSVTELTISAYGTTTVALPQAAQNADCKGDGVITENEWRTALSESSFTNVKMIINGDSNYTCWLDENIIKIVMALTSTDPDTGVPITINTTQYYVRNNDTITSYISTDESDYVVSPSNLNAWNVFYSNFFEFGALKDMYAMFSFNGYTATWTVEGISSFEVRFDEQERLTFYAQTLSGDTTSYVSKTYSSYGQVSLTLPTNIIVQ